MQGWARMRQPLASPMFYHNHTCTRCFATGDYSYKRRRIESDDIDTQEEKHEREIDVDLSEEAGSSGSAIIGDAFAEFRRRYHNTKMVKKRHKRPSHSGDEDDGTWHYRPLRSSEEELKPLPLPPFLWRDPKLKQTLKRSDYPSTYQPERHGIPTKKNLRRAEFSTHLAQNPYAAALAKPVRQCAFSDTRLPTSCLIGFHPVANEEKKITELVPLGLHAALIPKKKAYDKLTQAEKEAISANEYEEKLLLPRPPATYMTCQKRAMDCIAEDKKKLFYKSLVTARVDHIRENPFDLRKDMPSIVLDKLRHIVVRRLRFWFGLKGQDLASPGLLSALPAVPEGESGKANSLARLDEVEDVMCVLKLNRTTKEPNKNTDTSIAGPCEMNHESIQPPSYELHKVPPDPGELDLPDAMQDERTGILRIEDDLKHYNEFDGGKATTPLHDPPHIALDENSTPNPHSTTYQHKVSWWTDKLPSFMSEIVRPLQPAPNSPPSTLHFATAPYRNHRVPIYHLHHMLGPEYMEKLIQGTAFSTKRKSDGEDSSKGMGLASIDYAVLTRHRGTVEAQIWLMKLAAFVAKRKDEPFEAM